jgi:hypothetical protein
MITDGQPNADRCKLNEKSATNEFAADWLAKKKDVGLATF